MDMEATRSCCFSSATYPEALATHAQVIADSQLFLSTLVQFHQSLGTRLSIPKIGGKDLDLHFLYKEVTARGGLQVVIKERKWKEIAYLLNFPPTTTSASYVLRKFYSNFLHHYEQVYFFRIQGPLVPAPVVSPSPVISNTNSSECDPMHTPTKNIELEPRKEKLESAQALGVDPASSIGSVVTGSIDGKFDQGYLITVMVGARKMKGVLYHISPNRIGPQRASVSNFSFSANAEAFKFKKKRKERARKDPNAPRQNRSGYTFFFAELRAKFKSNARHKNREISKMIGDLWNQLPEEEKLQYQERGLRDKERYLREMHEYREKNRRKDNLSDGADTPTTEFNHSNSELPNTAQI